MFGKAHRHRPRGKRLGNRLRLGVPAGLVLSYGTHRCRIEAGPLAEADRWIAPLAAAQQALAAAKQGVEPDDIARTAARAGYDVSPIRAMIDMLAAR